MRRRLLPGTLALIVFWVGYAITAAYVLYVETPPVSRFLLVALGAYAVMLAALTVVVLRRPPPATCRGGHSGPS